MIVPPVLEDEWLAALGDLPVWAPPPKHVVVLAPHLDDETLGAGGFIAAQRLRGTDVVVVAATDERAPTMTHLVYRPIRFAGASFGYATLWTALLSFPLMAAIQLMCAHLGTVTGCGLASVIRTRYSRWVLWLACTLVAIANVFNIGADLGGMAEATEIMTGVRAYYWAPFFAALILGLLLWAFYRTMAQIFKWLTLVLFAYVSNAFLAHPDWRAVARATFVPTLNTAKTISRCCWIFRNYYLALSLLLASGPGGGGRPR